MKFINMSRQSGKTTYVVRKLRKNPKAVMITFCEMQKKNLKGLYPDIADRIFTMEEFVGEDVLRGQDFEESYIDDLDLCLARLRPKIKAATFTKEIHPTFKELEE